MKMVSHIIVVIVAFVLLCSIVSAQENLRETGIEHYRGGRFDQAVEALAKAVAEDKNDRTAWTYLGGAQLRLGNEKEAKKSFSRGESPLSKRVDDDSYESNLKITSKRPCRYTEEARSNNIVGSIYFVVEFLSDGKIGFVAPYQTLPYGLTEQCTVTVRQMKFTPAVKSGQPVTVLRHVSFSFNIF